MPTDIDDILKIEVPVIVQISDHMLTLEEIMELTPGSIIELPKDAEDELDILVQNKSIGLGSAVKVGENFGIRVSYVGDVTERINAMGGEGTIKREVEEEELDADALAEQLLSGQ